MPGPSFLGGKKHGDYRSSRRLLHPLPRIAISNKNRTALATEPAFRKPLRMEEYEMIGEELGERLAPILATVASSAFTRGLRALSMAILLCISVEAVVRSRRSEDDLAVPFLFGCCLAVLLLHAASLECSDTRREHMTRGILSPDFIPAGAESRRVAIGPAAA